MDGGGGIVGRDGVEAWGVVLFFFLGLELLFIEWASSVCAIGSVGGVCVVDSMSSIKVRGNIIPYSWVIKSLRSMLSASPENITIVGAPHNKPNASAVQQCDH